MEPNSIESALRSPAAWPERPAEVGFLETHISRLYFVGARVYKVKKAIRLPFLDYGSLERRRHFCEEELRLNRRLAPDVYLRVAPIARAADGSIALDGPGQVVEWAVEMVRLAARDMLDAKLDRGEVDNALLGELTVLLARFHADAATGAGVDEHGCIESVARNVRENFSELEALDARGVHVRSEGLARHLSRAAERFLSAESELFAARVAGGRIREGHGDLHAGNVCATARGLVVYDCIEFSARLRCSDVACDLAFLAMDLDARGFRAFSTGLVKGYAELARDRELERLNDFYKAYRAVVRGKVAALRCSAAVSASARREAQAESMRYLHLAASYDLPPLLVLTCGLPATGKSWVAAHVERPFEAVSASSDVRRKLLAQVPLHEHRRAGYEAGLYAPEMKARTYESLLASARSALERRRSVVVDATFSSRARRAPFRALARELGVPFVVVWCTADEAEVRRRMTERARDPAQASDADWSVYLRARESFEEPGELDASELVRHASGPTSGEECVARVIDRALEQVPRSS